jgi:hypothetical protein
MQLRRQDNVAYAAIADSTAASPGAVVITPSTLADGAAALVDEGNLAYVAQAAFDALDDSTRLRVVQNIGGELVFSAAFTKGAIIKSAAIGGNNTYATVKQFAAAQQQITRIGYNGTTGALPTTTVESSFFIKIRKNDLDAANRSQPNSLFAQFKTDATGSQEELAFGLVKNGIKNMSTQPEGNNGYLKFEMLNAGARTAATATGVVTLTFTKDSTLVTASAATASTNIVAGDYVAIAAATTSGVYKVKSKDGSGNLTLETAYQSATTTIVASAANIRIANAAAVAAASGVQLTGIVSDFDVDAFRNYYSNRFTATFSDTSTLNTHVQGAKDGVGVWQQVAMEEYMSMGNQGENSMLGVPPVMRTSSVVTDGQYDCLQISVKEDINGLVSAEKADADILVFIQDGSGSPTGLGIATALGVQADLT